jgi:recombination protein RecA
MAKKAKEKQEASEKVTKDSSMDEVLAKIKKQFGDDCIRLMSDSRCNKSVDVISTGSIMLDDALGIGGLPRGRIVELFGPEMGGKTTLALHVIATAQKMGHYALFIDAEHALNMSLVKNIGVDPAKLAFCQPDNGEQALSVLESGVSSGKFAIAVVDSVAALTPKAEIDGDMGDSHMGLQARLMGQAMRKLNGVVSKSNTLVIFINQLRQRIGVIWGSNETTTGGNALKFYASVRLDIRRIKGITVSNTKEGAGDDDDGDDKKDKLTIGNVVRIKVVKNKLAPPFREVETEIIFAKGINRAYELLTVAKNLDIVERSGARLYYNEEEFANGQVKGIEVINTNKAFADQLYKDILAKRSELTTPIVDASTEEVEVSPEDNE